MKIIYAIPGLGTTKELFSRLKIDRAELKVLDWPELSEMDTLETYAQKFSIQIDTRQPYYLMGVSFGGMLCMELNKILKPEKIFLVSSCKSPAEFPGRLKLFRFLPLYKLMSEAQLKKMAENSYPILGFEKKYLKEFRAMLDQMKPHYFKRSIQCLMHWNSTAIASGNIIQIHGDADRLLSLRNVKADFIIRKGTHAAILYQAEEISEIINTHIL
jgi:hypothetical protein